MSEQLRYERFEATDFLKDPFFVGWVRMPEQESEDFWQEWLRLHPHRASVVLQAKQLILSIEYRKNEQLSDQETVEMLERIIRKTGQRYIVPPAKRRAAGWWWSASVAAILLLSFFIAYQTDFFDPKDTVQVVAQPSWKLIEVPRGQKSVIRLPDGSLVRLNAESQLRIREPFADSVRLVELSGEAFFEVEHDPSTPFIIRAGKVQTKVLGTSFNVAAHPQKAAVSVAVFSGKVAVSTQQQVVEAEPLESIIYSESTEYQPSILTKQQIADPKESFGWKDGILYFNKASFPEVFEKIERWYDVDIVLEPGLELKGRYSGEYKNKSLDKVMEGIAYTSGFSFSIKGKSVLLTTNQ